MDNMHDDMYNFYDDDEKVTEERHHSLEYLDDFYPIEETHLFDDPLDDEDETSGPPQMTTTTTIASFKCQAHAQHFQQQTTTVTLYQTHHRASSL